MILIDQLFVGATWGALFALAYIGLIHVALAFSAPKRERRP